MIDIDYDNSPRVPTAAGCPKTSILPFSNPPPPTAATLQERAFFETTPLLVVDRTSTSTIPHFSTKDILVGTAAGAGMLALLLIVLWVMRVYRKRKERKEVLEAERRERRAFEADAWGIVKEIELVEMEMGLKGDEERRGEGMV
jgi:heme exporter protein D